MTKTQIICYRMEELIILYHSNFAILRERVRDFAQHTSCSNHVADRTLRSQILLDKLRREHLGWTTTHKQEWGLFLLENMLQNAASMKKEVCERCSHRSQSEKSKEEAPEHPLVRTFIGTTDEAIIQVAEQVY